MGHKKARVGGNIINNNNHKLTTANRLFLITPQSNRPSQENKLRKQEQKESGVDHNKRDQERNYQSSGAPLL